MRFMHLLIPKIDKSVMHLLVRNVIHLMCEKNLLLLKCENIFFFLLECYIFNRLP